MRQHIRLAVAASAFTLMIVGAQAHAHEVDSTLAGSGDRCAWLGRLSSAQLRKTAPAAHLLDVKYVESGDSFRTEDGKNYSSPNGFCRVKLRIKVSRQASAGTELWLPDAWTGRYLQSGSGGWAGEISYDGLKSGVLHGFATANSDEGHKGQGVDISWALGPGGVARWRAFGHQADLAVARAAKALVSTYYRAPAHHSYFSGCSDGGREGLAVLQRHPATFDGWLIGAPMNDFARTFVAELYLGIQSRRAFSDMTMAQLNSLQSFTLKNCDDVDGVHDGLISNPSQCRINLSQIRCSGATNDNCLTASQIVGVEAIWQGYRSPNLRLPGLPYSVGTEAGPGQWSAWLSGLGKQMPGGHEEVATEFFAKFILKNPRINLDTLDLDDLYVRTRRAIGDVADATNAHLDTARRMGRKIIQYHGWSDVGVPPDFSLDYFRRVEELNPNALSFYSLYMVPGVGHCGGGFGPDRFGQPNDMVSAFDPADNMLAALVAWVEQRRQPGAIVAHEQSYADSGIRHMPAGAEAKADLTTKSSTRTTILYPFHGVN